MYTSILVPVDRSQFGEYALTPGAVVARRIGVPMRLVHVLPPRVTSAGGYGFPAAERTIDAEERRDASEYLERLAERVRAEAGVEVHAELLGGDVISTLLEAADRFAPALIVLTTHGHGGWRRAVLGSVADALVRRSSSAVLAIRPSVRQPGFAEDGAVRVLLPLDGSERDDEILDHAQVVSRAVRAEILLLRVVQPQHDKSRLSVRQIDRTDLREQREKAKAYLDHIAQQLGRFKLPVAVPVAVHVAVDDEVVQGILDVAGGEKIGLIAMATRGRGGLERLREGSVADRVLRGADAAVLLFRASDGT